MAGRNKADTDDTEDTGNTGDTEDNRDTEGTAGTAGTAAVAAADVAGERFEDLVSELVGTAGVTPPTGGRGFGRTALRFDGKIFAMLVRGRLVVKLTAARVDELVAAGDGDRFDANKGTPMKEWFAVDPESSVEWSALAREALAFAAAK